MNMKIDNTDNLSKILIKENFTIKEAMKTIDKSGFGIALAVDDDKHFLGLVSDGDIRRAIINGIDIHSSVNLILNKNPIIVNKDISDQQIIDLMIKKNVVGKIPVLDDTNKIIDLAMLSSSIYGSNEYGTQKDDQLYFLNKQRNVPFIKKVHKVLIIGGAGYLGSVLSRKLLEKNYKIKIFDKLMFGINPITDLLKNKDFELIKGDICNINEVSSALLDVDAVILLAGIVGDPASSLNPKKTIEVNYISTKMIAELCKYNQINRLIFASSCSVYGVNQSLVTEDSELNPISLYSRSKVSSEKGILELTDQNFSPTILRMGTLYGYSPRMRLDLVVNTLSAKAVKNKKIEIFGGEQYRPFIHVEDAAEAYIKVLEAPIEKIKGKIFNVGSYEQNYRIIDIGKAVSELIKDVDIVINKDNVDKRDYRVSFDKINKELNFQPRKTVKEGIIEIKNLVENGILTDIDDVLYHNYNYENIFGKHY